MKKLNIIVALFAFAATATAQNQTPLVLTLGDAARLAAKQSAPAVIAQLRTAEAQARVTQRRADLLPTLRTSALESGHTLNSATFGFDFPTPEGETPLLDPNGQIIGPVNTLDLRAHVTVPAIDFAARQRVTAARTGVTAAQAAALSAADQAAATAALAYVRAARADAMVAARAADSTLADSLLVIANAQLRAGVGVALDVTRARSQLAAIHSQLIAARGEQSRSRLELVRVIGVPLETEVRIAEPLAGTVDNGVVPSEADAVATALRERADVTAADRALEAAKQSTRAIRAERLPALSAFADDGAIGTSTAHMLNTYTWGVQVSLPIFDGAKRAGREHEQEAIASQLDVQRRELERTVTVEVRSALLDLGVANEQVHAANGRLALAQQEYTQAQDRFKAGVAGNADVVTAALSLNSARNGVIDAVTAYESARVGLARAEGIATRLP
ncbi:MAG TPA: TolC family protein [Gemmatimonadaceae bacterium]